jgi:hypothetical protein
MKMFITLFVLILGLTLISANAQEPSPTPAMTRLFVSNLLPPSNIRVGGRQDLQYAFFISQDSYTISAKDANTLNYTFTQTRTVSPAKSRTRVRFF